MTAMMQQELEIPDDALWLSEWVGEEMVVYPLGDRDEHALGSENCECQPQVEYPGDKGIKMIVHNAFDGRE